jgi:PAS domain S-box-containing protein
MNMNPILTPEKQFTAIENAFDGIALLDDQGIYFYMNKAHAQLFGYEQASELVGKSWKTIYDADYAEKIEKEVFPVLMAMGYWTGETIGIDKQGKPILQYISLTLLPDMGLICVCRDISKEINANRLNYLMSNLGKGILVEDESHKVVLVNAQFCNLFKIPVEPAQMVGADCLTSLDQALYLFADPEQIKKEVIGLVSAMEPVIGAEVAMADGKILERDYIPIIIGNTFKGQLWSYTDVTLNKQLQKSLEEAKNRAVASEKAKSTFLSTVSHEIRTPMHAIMGFAEQLTLTRLDDQQRYYIHNIQDAANGLLGIINDILDMTKIEAGKLNIELGVVNLREILKSVENILEPKAAEKGLSLITCFDDQINDRLNGDAIRIRQILMNILGNAIKFTDSGSIHLSMELKLSNSFNQVIQMTCIDTGIGIAKDAVELVFNDFYQENSGGYNGLEGTGLGLSITKKLVDMMSGTIKLESEKGMGTSVHIEIPFPLVPGQASHDLMHNMETCDDMQEKRVLIVEDNKLNRNLFVMMLQNMGCLVSEAENGKEALDIIERQHFDIVLMDIQMPVMDGPTALSKLRERSDRHIPVIALTATAFQSEISHMLNMGFADCITKPIDQKNLHHRLCLFFKRGKSESLYNTSLKETILTRITEMAGNDQAKVANLMQYLLEEVKLAVQEWQTALLNRDWESARKILHREKMMIHSVGIQGMEKIILDIENDQAGKSDEEMHLMISRLIDLFLDIEKMFILGDY